MGCKVGPPSILSQMHTCHNFFPHFHAHPFVRSLHSAANIPHILLFPATMYLHCTMYSAHDHLVNLNYCNSAEKRTTKYSPGVTSSPHSIKLIKRWQHYITNSCIDLSTNVVMKENRERGLGIVLSRCLDILCKFFLVPHPMNY